MKQLLASTEFQYKENGKEYHKVYVSKSDGSMLQGSRTLRAFTGSALKRVQKQMQEAIDRGAWN